MLHKIVNNITVIYFETFGTSLYRFQVSYLEIEIVQQF